MRDFKNINDFMNYVAREFFKKKGVHRYRTVKIEDMSDDRVFKACHWYCSENNLLDEYNAFYSQQINKQNAKEYIGKTIEVTIDRPLGSYHPEHQQLVYPINYGFFEDLYAPDDEPQDVYVLGVYEPISSFTGKVIAIIHRLNDIEDKWVVAPEEYTFSKEDIIEATAFQEKYFEIEIKMQEDFCE